MKFSRGRKFCMFQFNPLLKQLYFCTRSNIAGVLRSRLLLERHISIDKFISYSFRSIRANIQTKHSQSLALPMALVFTSDAYMDAALCLLYASTLR